MYTEIINECVHNSMIVNCNASKEEKRERVKARKAKTTKERQKDRKTCGR
jgi:hypothetical protein